MECRDFLALLKMCRHNVLMKKLIMMLLWVIGPGLAFAQSVDFGLNDLSILLPLPQSGREEQALLRTQDGAWENPLMQSWVFDRLPQLIINDPDPELRLRQLRVIALRFDPCFSEGDAPTACRRQIRLVFQPVSQDVGKWMTFDVAIHAFYDFSEAEWKNVLQDWKSTAVGHKNEALQIHPLIKQQGLLGPHWQKIKQLILKHCGWKNITRITASTTNNFGMQWTFVGFDVDARKQLRPIVIPRTEKTIQIFFANLGNLNEFSGSYFPPPQGDADLAAFVKSSVKAKQIMTEEQLLQIMGQVQKFEDPRKTNPGNVDCVSCHIAQTVHGWGRRHLSDLLSKENVFPSSWNLQNMSVQPFFINRVRAFGYFLDEPLFSQRVIHETALVADQIQQAFAKISPRARPPADSKSISH